LSVVLADGGDGGVGRGGGPLKLCFSKKNSSKTIPGVLLRLSHIAQALTSTVQGCQWYSSQERPWFDHTIAITITV